MAARLARRIVDLSSDEAAYLAGIVDGEGSIYVRRRGEVGFPIVAITNTSVELIEYLSMRLKGRAPRTLTPAKGATKRAYQIEVSALNDVAYLLCALLPWLIVKRDRAVEALRIIQERDDG